MHPLHIIFDGYKYRLHPNGYYMADQWTGGPHSTLHRAVWAFHNGPIPDGYHVHHKDENPANNDIENLEAMPAAKHLAHHAAESGWVGSEANKAQLRAAGELAKEWHASPEGLEWHRAHGKASWVGRTLYLVSCQEIDCADTFITPFPTRAKYCCSACKVRSNYRRQGRNLKPRRGPQKGAEYGSRNGKKS